jgi:hypothetical protein
MNGLTSSKHDGRPNSFSPWKHILVAQLMTVIWCKECGRLAIDTREVEVWAYVEDSVGLINVLASAKMILTVEDGASDDIASITKVN